MTKNPKGKRSQETQLSQQGMGCYGEKKHVASTVQVIVVSRSFSRENWRVHSRYGEFGDCPRKGGIC